MNLDSCVSVAWHVCLLELSINSNLVDSHLSLKPFNSNQTPPFERVLSVEEICACFCIWMDFHFSFLLLLLLDNDYNLYLLILLQLIFVDSNITEYELAKNILI